MTLHKTIRLIPTDINLLIVVQEDPHKAGAFLMEHLGIDDDYSHLLKQSGVFTLSLQDERDSGKLILIYLRDFDSAEMAHESAHVAYHLADIIGMKYSSDCQEMHSSYVGYIMQEILEIERRFD